MDNNITQEEQERINRETELSNQLNAKLRDAKQFFDHGEFAKAKPLLEEYITSALELNKEDVQHRFFSFANIAEFFYAINKIKLPENQTMVWTSLNFSLAYNMLSYIANEEGNHDKAIEYCDKAIYYNPIESNLYFEKSESYKYKKDFLTMAKVARETYNILFNHVELARYYRILGFYYTEIQKYDISFALYLISIHFDRVEGAYHELGYIKQQLNDPNYTMTTEKALELLKQEGIPYGISEENKNILLNSLKDQTVVTKYPAHTEFVNKELEILNKPMEKTEELFVSNSKPKITAEDVIDDNKIIKDEQDKERERKNIEIIKSQNIPYIENMRNVPINSATTLRSKEELVKRMLGNYVISYFSMLTLKGEPNLENDMDKINQKLGIKANLEPGDINLVNKIIAKQAPEEFIKNQTWLIEGTRVLMWVLGLLDKPSLGQECDFDQISSFLAGCNSYEDLLFRCNLKAKEEVLEFADLVTRYYWASQEARIKNQPLPQLNEGVLFHQSFELNWALDFSLLKIMKNKINVSYEKDDLAFTFTTPSKYNIEEVNAYRNLLFSLYDPVTPSKISFIDLGKYNIDSFAQMYRHDLDFQKTNKWEVVNEYTIRSINFKDEINKVVLSGKTETGTLITIRYYFKLNDHVICLAVILTYDANINDMNSIENNPNNQDAMGVLNSIRENANINEPSKIEQAGELAKQLNFGMHAKQLNIPLLDGFVEQKVDNPMIVFAASNSTERYIAQLAADGPLGQNETFEQRINLVLDNVKKHIAEVTGTDAVATFTYFEDYSNGVFNYKVYVQDLVITTENGKSVFRSFNAFFVEHKFNDFYQMSITEPPILLGTVNPGVVDLQNDSISRRAYELFKQMMDNLKYNN